MAFSIKIADQAQWLELRQELWPHTTLDQHKTNIERMNSDGDLCLIAADQNELAGFLELRVRPYVDGAKFSPVLHIEGLYVREKFRRNGLAGNLISAAEKWAKEKGFSEITSDANIANLASEKFHKMNGFEETERVIYFRKALK